MVTETLPNIMIVDMPALLVKAGLAPSLSQAKRLLTQGAVRFNGVVNKRHQMVLASGPFLGMVDEALVSPGDVISVGKRRFVRIADADTAGS